MPKVIYKYERLDELAKTCGMALSSLLILADKSPDLAVQWRRGISRPTKKTVSALINVVKKLKESA